MEWECGGGTILIFLLTTYSGVEQHIAQGANIFFFIPTCIVAIIVNLKNKNIEMQTAKIVMISGIIGAIIGAILSINFHTTSLKKYFGYFLIIMASFEIFSIIKSYIKRKKDNNNYRKKSLGGTKNEIY